MLLGIIIGLFVGAGLMHLINKKKVDGLTISLSEIQSKLKSTRHRKMASRHISDFGIQYQYVYSLLLQQVALFPTHQILLA